MCSSRVASQGVGPCAAILLVSNARGCSGPSNFTQAVGGFGHFLMMSQAGQMGHEDTVDSMTLFAREVMPRLQDFHSAAQLAA